jgi:hypothetical protein
VHQDNEEALRWYAARGFYLEEAVIESYYRRLKSGGARIVRLDLQWGNSLDENGPDNTRKSNCCQDSDETGQRLLKEEDDDDWEKVEKEDEGQDEHGGEHLADTFNFDGEDGLTRKRKADEGPC